MWHRIPHLTITATGGGDMDIDDTRLVWKLGWIFSLALWGGGHLGVLYSADTMGWVDIHCVRTVTLMLSLCCLFVDNYLLLDARCIFTVYDPSVRRHVKARKYHLCFFIPIALVSLYIVVRRTLLFSHFYAPTLCRTENKDPS